MENFNMVKKNKFEESLNALSPEEFIEQERMLGKSLHLIKSEDKNVPIDKVDLHPEWQPRASTDESRLFNPICLEGLATRPKVYVDSKGQYHALDGRHRWAALLKIETDRPDVFARHQFDKGIPCQVYSNLTEAQILDLRTDEGRGQQPLANKVEAWNALRPHYEASRTDKQIEQAYWKIFADTCCSTSKRTELYDAFRKATDPKQFALATHNATYVHQIRFRALYRCPKVVRDQWVNGELGNKDSSGVTFTKLTDSDLKTLAKAANADAAQDEADGFAENYGVDNPGPGVLAVYDEIMAAKAGKATTPQQQPMSKADREIHVKDGKSRAEKTIFSAVQGNPNSLALLDGVLAYIATFDKADAIDTDTVSEVCLAVIKRGSRLSEESRRAVLDIILTVEEDVVDPKPRNNKNSKKKDSVSTK